MSKMVKIMKNKLMIAAMVAVMVFGTAMVPVHAAAVETNYYGGGATYTYYIRKSGSSAELGYMRITRTKSAIKIHLQRQIHVTKLHCGLGKVQRHQVLTIVLMI